MKSDTKHAVTTTVVSVVRGDYGNYKGVSIKFFGDGEETYTVLLDFDDAFSLFDQLERAVGKK